jgi:hypothetical protein
MGVSSVPQKPSDDAYRDAFKFAATAGEVILIQRVPPWEEFEPGGTISDRTNRLTRLERDLAHDNGLKLFLAIDPTDPADRGRLAALPDDLRGRDFTDNRVRSAFISYAKYLALNYKPTYLALGVEVDMFFNRRGDAAFRSFQSLYFEAYDAVKDVSADTLVFPTFQYENMQALLSLSPPSQPTWALVSRFDPKLRAVPSVPSRLLCAWTHGLLRSYGQYQAAGIRFDRLDIEAIRSASLEGSGHVSAPRDVKAKS